ncbi:MAG: hypothetical protein JXB00_19260 [Bacteroidales bacterium]|nr:hypothetical protein [Bacteroidales bacterium]
MKQLNSFINRYFGMILLISAILGLFIPLPDINTVNIIMISLALIIFSSFFRIELNRDLFTKDIKPVSLFFFLRYLVMPVAAFYLLHMFSPFYAIAFLLLLLMPAAVSSPSFSAMFNGNVSLALKILVFTSFLSIFSIPFICQILLTQDVETDSKHMFLTMVYTIVIPFIVHIPVRKIHKIRTAISDNNPLITAIGLIVIFISATSRNRDIIFENPEKILIYIIISFIAFLVFYLIGYYLLPGRNKTDRIAFSVSSGANNIGLGVTITALFFPGDTNVFFIVSQLAWIFALIPMRYFYRRNI